MRFLFTSYFSWTDNKDKADNYQSLLQIREARSRVPSNEAEYCYVLCQVEFRRSRLLLDFPLVFHVA